MHTSVRTFAELVTLRGVIITISVCARRYDTARVTLREFDISRFYEISKKKGGWEEKAPDFWVDIVLDSIFLYYCEKSPGETRDFELK